MELVLYVRMNTIAHKQENDNDIGTFDTTNQPYGLRTHHYYRSHPFLESISLTIQYQKGVRTFDDASLSVITMEHSLS